MIIVAFIIYALHYFFIIHWVAGAARWSANTLADIGYEHAAYYAGLGWVNSDILYWALYFFECFLVAYIIQKASQTPSNKNTEKQSE